MLPQSREQIQGTLSESVQAFIQLQTELLKLERAAEMEENARLTENAALTVLERRGIALIRMGVLSTKTGMYGRTVISFVSSRGGAPQDNSMPLPATKIRSGDILSVNSTGGGGLKVLGSGVVSRLTRTTVSVAFEEVGPPPEVCKAHPELAFHDVDGALHG